MSKDGVADVVTVRIVDFLERVDIPDDAGHFGLLPRLFAEVALEQPPIADARQGVLFSGR